MPNNSKLTAKVESLIVDALNEDFNKTNELVTWDSTFTVFPDPSPAPLSSGDSGDPSQLALLPALLIYLELVGAKPDTSVYLSIIVPPYRATKANITKQVNDGLDTLRKERAAQFDQLEN